MLSWARRTFHKISGKKMLVYRIETRDGQGPYNDIGYNSIHLSPIDYNRHPLPGDDGLGSMRTYDAMNRFGFNSLKQLDDWFGDNRVLVYLHDSFFAISVYEIEEQYVHQGRKQLVFNSTKAKKVMTIPLEQFAKASKIDRVSPDFALGGFFEPSEREKNSLFPIPDVYLDQFGPVVRMEVPLQTWQIQPQVPGTLQDSVSNL